MAAAAGRAAARGGRGAHTLAALSARWELRPATAADRRFLFELNRAALGEYVEATWGWDEEFQERYFEERFERRLPHLGVVVVQGVDAGVLETEERGDELYVSLLELAPAFQGQGIGPEIMHGLLDQGRPVSLHVLRANPRAQRFYESLGLRVVEEDEVRVFMRRGIST